MKKSIFSLMFVIGMVASSFAQMAIPGEIFAANPAKFNGRKVTIKNIEIVKTDAHGGPGGVIGGPAGSFQAAPGAVGTPSAPATHPCRPPRGFSQVDVFFRGEPAYQGCFFMADNMKTQLDKEMGHENAPAQISFRGDSRGGYHITMYRLGL